MSRLSLGRRSVARLMVLLTAFAGSGAFVLAGATAAHAAITDPFTRVFSANTTGNIQIRGNTVVTCQSTASLCGGAQAMTNPTAGDNNNNAFFMTYVDADSDATTFDSSSATVNIPTGGSVLFAALAWGGNTTAGAVPSLATQPSYGSGTAAGAPTPGSAGVVELKVPGSSSYVTETSTRTDFLSGSAGPYQGYVNVTAAIQAAGNGSYTVANLQTATGENIHGGWSLTIAYSNPLDPPRNLTIFAGFGTVSSAMGSNVVDIPLTGFQTPATGAVNTTLGAVSYEGDAGSTGDQLQLGDTVPDLQNVSDALHNVGNTFTSAISDLGVDSSTRTPKYVNQLGFDAATFNVDGFLPNNATGATIRLTSSNETYYPGIVTFATDLYAPVLTVTKSVAVVTKAPGNTQAGIAEAGDTLKYTIDATNSGADQSDTTVLTDTIPTGTIYVAASLTSGGTALTDATGDDIGNFNSGTKLITVDVGTGGTSAAGGVVAPAASIATVTFEVVVNHGLAGGSTITNAAGLSYVGHQTSIAFTGTSNTVTSPVPNSAPIANPDSPTTPYQQAATVDVLANDTDSNADPLTITATTVASHGTVTVVAGKIVYTPAAGFSGTDSFTYTISDGHGGTATGSVTVTVTAAPVVPPVVPVVPVVAPAPVAVADTATTSFGAPVTINVLANDSSGVSGTPPTIVAGSVTPPVDSGGVHRGTVTLVGGQLVFVPPAGFAGTVTFSYSITNGLGVTSTASVTVTVQPLALATGATTVTVAAGAGSVSVSPTVTVKGHGTLTIVSVTQPASNATVTVVNGALVVTPVAGFVGTVTFSYVVVGADGTQDTITVTTHVLGEQLALPFTGSNVESLGVAGLLLIFFGMGALLMSRRARRSTSTI